MELLLVRNKFLFDRTLGELYVDGDYECCTMEDTDRFLEDGNEKIPKETAIPRGRYKVKMLHSNHFGRLMPFLLDVPQFTGIMLHAGNKPEDTRGCILVGKEIVNNRLVESRIVSDRINMMIMASISRKENVVIEIV